MALEKSSFSRCPEEKTGKRVISSKNANELQSKSVKKISNETK